MLWVPYSEWETNNYNVNKALTCIAREIKIIGTYKFTIFFPLHSVEKQSRENGTSPDMQEIVW